MSYFGELVEGEDFYFENGKCVFTRAYLLKRGYCCGSGCRHCPYRNAGPETAAAEEETRS